jgi:hypothetical protein
VLNEIYHALFKDVYNQNSAGQEVVKIDENPFQEFEGRVVRKIYVKTLRVFGESVNDTARKAQGFEKFFSALHTNTRESIIRKSFLLFHTGDIIDADRLRDNERVMRNSTILHDARILVVPDEQYPNLVDLLVITQDIWSLIPDVNFGGFDRYDLSINQVNFRGLGHSWRNTFISIKKNHPNSNMPPPIPFHILVVPLLQDNWICLFADKPIAMLCVFQTISNARNENGRRF